MKIIKKKLKKLKKNIMKIIRKNLKKCFKCKHLEVIMQRNKLPEQVVRFADTLVVDVRCYLRHPGTFPDNRLKIKTWKTRAAPSQ